MVADLRRDTLKESYTVVACHRGIFRETGMWNVECLGHGREGKAKIVSNGGKRSLKRARRVTRLQEVQQTNELWSHTPLTRYETVRKLCKVS